MKDMTKFGVGAMRGIDKMAADNIPDPSQRARWKRVFHKQGFLKLTRNVLDTFPSMGKARSRPGRDLYNPYSLNFYRVKKWVHVEIIKMRKKVDECLVKNVKAKAEIQQAQNAVEDLIVEHRREFYWRDYEIFGSRGMARKEERQNQLDLLRIYLQDRIKHVNRVYPKMCRHHKKVSPGPFES